MLNLNELRLLRRLLIILCVSLGVIAGIMGGLFVGFKVMAPQVDHVLIKENFSEGISVDAIVVLGGGSGSRVRLAADYFHRGVSDRMIMTASSIFDQSYSQLMSNYAQKNGVPKSAIFLEEQSLSTKDHPIYVGALLESFQCKSVLIVTSLYHTRRSYAAFEKYFSSYYPDIDVYIVGAKDGIDYSRWWTDHEMLEAVGFELVKMVYYSLFSSRLSD